MQQMSSSYLKKQYAAVFSLQIIFEVMSKHRTFHVSLCFFIVLMEQSEVLLLFFAPNVFSRLVR